MHATAATNSLHSQWQQMKINCPWLTRFLTTHFFHYFGTMHHHRRRPARRRRTRAVKRDEYPGYKARTNRELPQFLCIPLPLYFCTYSYSYVFLRNPRHDEKQARELDQRRDSSPSRLRPNWISARSINSRMGTNTGYSSTANMAQAYPSG